MGRHLQVLHLFGIASAITETRHAHAKTSLTTCTFFAIASFTMLIVAAGRAYST